MLEASPHAEFIGEINDSQKQEFLGKAAALLGCDPGEVAFVKNTSEGIATVAMVLDWRPGVDLRTGLTTTAAWWRRAPAGP